MRAHHTPRPSRPAAALVAAAATILIAAAVPAVSAPVAAVAASVAPAPAASAPDAAALVAASQGASTSRVSPGARIARVARVLPASVPDDFAQPEGRSRWRLRTVAPAERFERTLVVDDADRSVVLRDGPGGEATRYADRSGGDAALRWLLPDRVDGALRPGAEAVLDLDADAPDGGRAERLRIELRNAGIGWLELPSGPREVVLQRALVLKGTAGGRGFVPEALVHRFVDPRAGVVAEIGGPVSADGGRRTAVSEATFVESILAGASSLILHTSDLWDVPFDSVNYGRDQGSGTTVASLTPTPGVTTAGDLIALDTWDFSGDTGGTEVAFTTTTVTAAETCNAAQCGYTTAGGQLERSDIDFTDPPNLDKVNDVAQLEVGPTTSTIWIRAGAEHEGKSGSFGGGESRFCYTGTWTDNNNVVHTRSQVPLWVLAHQDGPGLENYLQTGDTWTSPVFACEQNIFNTVCGSGGVIPVLYSYACGTHTGTQNAAVLKGGVVTLPSGHTFNALLVRNVADFCVNSARTCGSLFKVAEVRTVNYLWQVPHLGTVARIQSVQNATDTTSFTTLDQTDFNFGLFPPRSIAVTGSTDNTVSIAWDPGLDTHRIAGYKVYWDTDSGAASAYAFNSQANPAQASIAGTSATISGLTPGTRYYLTVTSLSTYTDPSTGVPTTYESLLYPTQVSGDPSSIYPVEVQALTTGGACVPTQEVTGLTVDYDPLGIKICWNPSSDSCLAGYDVLGATSPASAAGFSPIATAGLATCWSGSPGASSFFLVAARGTGGEGPWGHYGR